MKANITINGAELVKLLEEKTGLHIDILFLTLQDTQEYFESHAGKVPIASSELKSQVIRIFKDGSFEESK